MFDSSVSFNKPFIMQKDHILLRGFIALDFYSAADPSLTIQPLPDELIDHLDVIKKSEVQPSSFVDLLDNISANDGDSFTGPGGKKPLALQDLKTDIDFSIVRDGRAQSIFELARGLP